MSCFKYLTIAALLGSFLGCSSEDGDDGGLGAGESCTSDEQCASNECVGYEEGEGTCSSSDTGTPSGSCEIDGATVANGDYECDGSKLYLCSDGSAELARSCSGCDYVGAGTGSSYSTNCRDYTVGDEPSSWSSEQVSKYKGPGCYYGFDRICAP